MNVKFLNSLALPLRSLGEQRAIAVNPFGIDSMNKCLFLASGFKIKKGASHFSNEMRLLIFVQEALAIQAFFPGFGYGIEGFGNL